MFSLLHIQIIVEVAFFFAVLLLLWLLRRNIVKYRPIADGSAIAEIKRVMAESQEFSERFLSVMEKNTQALNNLLSELDEKRKQLAVQLDEAAAAVRTLKAAHAESDLYRSAISYEDVVQMLRQGMSREEALKRSGLSEDEINLVMELARTRAGQTQTTDSSPRDTL